MGVNNITQAHVRTDVTDFNEGQSSLELALFKPDGTPFDLTGASFDQAATVAAITTPDATDLATAQTLANANKAKINELITKLKAAGLVAAS